MKKLFFSNFISRKSFFFRFMYSYLLVLLIPFSTILIMSWHAQKAIQDEIISANTSRLNQFVNIIDSELGNMIEKAYQIRNSKIVRRQVLNDSTKSESAYDIYATKKYLNELPTDEFSDVFIYLSKNDRIISAINSSLVSREYYDTYYQNIDKSLPDTKNNYDAFYKTLRPSTPFPHLASFGSNPSSPSLCVILSANYSTNQRVGDVTVVLVILPELLNRIVTNALYQDEGSILIYNADNELLMSTKQEELNIDLSKYTGNSDNIYYDVLNGEEYIVQLLQSEVLNCTYLSLIPSQTFWEKHTGLRTISTISIILSMLVSIVLSWLLARRSFLPIHSIVHTIGNKSDFKYDLKKKSELDFIKEVLVNTFTENDMLSHKLKNSSNSLFEKYILHAMQGTLPNNKFFDSEMKQLKLNFTSDYFNLLIIHIDEVNERITGPLGGHEGQRILSFIVGNVMQELCAVSHLGFIINLLPGEYAVILNFSNSTPLSNRTEEALQIGHTFQSYVKENFDILCTISLGNPVEGIEHLNISYQQALSAMEYRYLIGKGSIIPYQDITMKKFSYSNAFNSKNTMILIQYVKENGDGDFIEIMGRIIENSGIDCNSSLCVIQCFKYDLINTINKIIYEIGAIDLEKQNNFMQTLIHAETFEEFQEVFKACILQLKKFNQENKERFTICDKAEKLIHECYMDINLNNSIIADKLNISPSYLSKLFRNEKNVSLLDYLYKVRLSYAKNFLKETDLTVEEIALKTGFISNSALIKAFNKYEGITPGSYRRLIN